MRETWKDIQGYESYYQISSLGNVRSKDRVITYKNGKKALHKGKLRKPSVCEYRMIALSKGNKVKIKKISRLVASHFLCRNGDKNIVNHIDGNKHNDSALNLEWCTYSENSIHAYSIGLNKSKKNDVPGVFYEERRGKWSAYIYRNSKNIFVGRFATKEEAIKSREKKLHDKNTN